MLWYHRNLAIREERITLGHEYAAKRGYSKAREQYSGILENEQAPGPYRALALFCISDTYVWEKKFDEASAELEKARDLKSLPPHFVLEVEDTVGGAIEILNDEPDEYDIALDGAGTVVPV